MFGIGLINETAEQMSLFTTLFIGVLGLIVLFMYLRVKEDNKEKVSNNG